MFLDIISKKKKKKFYLTGGIFFIIIAYVVSKGTEILESLNCSVLT